MSSSLEATARRRRPNPSERDLQIYLDYQITGKRQIDLAHDYKLTQCRISQIIRRVENWAQHSKFNVQGQQTAVPDSTPNLDPGALNSAAIDFQLQFQRLNLVCREAIRHFQQPQTTVTHKTGTRSDKQIDETNTRQHPANLQCLKIILQANAQHQRLSRSVSPSPPLPLSPTLNSEPATLNFAPLTRDDVESWLIQHHTQAQNDGQVPYEPSSHLIVRDFVSTLLGEPTSGLALDALAHAQGKKVVRRRYFDDVSVPAPPDDSYFPFYDADGSFIGWLPPDQQVAVPHGFPRSNQSIPPSDPDPSPGPPGSDSKPTAQAVPADSSTCIPASHSSQTPSAPALTSHSPPIQISLPPVLPPSSPNLAGLEFT